MLRSSSSSSSASKARSWPPRYLSPVTPSEARNGDGPYVVQFANELCRSTKDTISGRAGSPLTMRPWQEKLLGHLFAKRADGRRKHRTALIGMPRKNGKSALGAAIGLYGLTMLGDGAEVYSCAGDREQARIVFGMAKRMVELEPDLGEIIKPYRDVLEVPSTGAVYRCLSAEAYTKEGLSPNLVLFDEVHVQPSDDLWNTMSLGSAAVTDPLVCGITTAGARTDSLGRDTLCYRLYQHGQKVAKKEITDPSFFFAWWEPKRGAEADHRDPRVWDESNPGFGDLNDREDFESTVIRTTETEFRTKRTNVFTVASESALPHGVWDARARPGQKPQGRLVIFVDGSWAGDSTGIVGCDETNHLFVVDCWEKRSDDGPDWRVPIGDVKHKIITVCKDEPVRLAGFDPFRWQATMSELEEDGIPVVEFPTNAVARIVPAWKRFYDGVLDGALTHDGDPRLARHVENMVLKYDRHGARPVKEHKNSERHIDLGICAVGALSIAADLTEDERGPELW